MPSKKVSSQRQPSSRTQTENPTRASAFDGNKPLITLVLGVLLGGAMVYFMGNYRLISKDHYERLLDGPQQVTAAAPALPPALPPGANAGQPPPRQGPSGQLVGEEQAFDLSSAASKGPTDAAVKVVVFSDFECPACAQWAPQIHRIEERYQGKIQLIFKHLPLPFHSKAKGAAMAVEAARRQGKFWEMHDRLFQNQGALNTEDFLKYAGELTLDVGRFKSDLEDAQLKNLVQRDLEEAQRAQVPGTPTFFINGRRADIGPPQQLEALIDQTLNSG